MAAHSLLSPPPRLYVNEVWATLILLLVGACGDYLGATVGVRRQDLAHARALVRTRRRRDVPPNMADSLTALNWLNLKNTIAVNPSYFGNLFAVALTPISSSFL